MKAKLARTKAAKRAAEIERLRFQATSAFLKLEGLAQKDLAALEVLATELLFHVRRMNSDLLKNLEFARKLTRRCPTWPDVTSADKDLQQAQVWFRKQLQLGTQAGVNFQGRQWSRRTPEVRAALVVRSCVVSHKLKVPPFSRATAAKWWKAGRKFFNQIYGPAPENHPTFADYWRRGGQQHKASAQSSGLSQAQWIRKEILSKMPQAFRSIAPKT